MKTLNKFIFVFLLSFISIGIFSDSTVSANEPSIVISEDDSSAYSSDVIVWKYKTINGKLYKRKYNQTTKKWIGSWVLA